VASLGKPDSAGHKPTWGGEGVRNHEHSKLNKWGLRSLWGIIQIAVSKKESGKKDHERKKTALIEKERIKDPPVDCNGVGGRKERTRKLCGLEKSEGPGGKT